MQFWFWKSTKYKLQDSIPVGCVPSAWQPYVFQQSPLDANTGGGHQVKKFEQVFSNDHQMSVEGEGSRSPSLVSRTGEGEVPSSDVWEGVIPYHVTYPMMHVQGGHILVKMKFPVFSLSFPCVTEIFPVLFLCKN